jgi:hypothetical protein
VVVESPLQVKDIAKALVIVVDGGWITHNISKGVTEPPSQLSEWFVEKKNME